MAEKISGKKFCSLRQNSGMLFGSIPIILKRTESIKVSKTLPFRRTVQTIK